MATYRGKLNAIAADPSIDRLVAVAPPVWQEPGGRALTFEPSATEPAYELRIEPIRFNGNFHVFYWPTLHRVLADVRPDVVHLDEEPYNVATGLGTLQARQAGAKTVFFTWQNLLRRYPPPFSLMEQFVFRRSAHAIAGSQEALQVMRAKGYRGPASVIPQFGIDPALFTPAMSSPSGTPRIGFVARLVEEKGIFVLLQALAGLPGEWQLCVFGSGPLLQAAQARATELGIGARITWEPGVASTQMAQHLQGFTILVQPSLTRKHWKEQFGRALMEAMACGVPVVGSDSGEIPHLVGDAGLIVPEGDVVALRSALQRLLEQPALRQKLGDCGRARALAHFTHAQIATQTVDVYRSIVGVAAGTSATISTR